MDGAITLIEYESTLGQEQKWLLEYTGLRSYESEITNYQWFNIMNRDQADWDWMNRQGGDTISQEEYIMAQIELELFNRLDGDADDRVDVTAFTGALHAELG